MTSACTVSVLFNESKLLKLYALVARNGCGIVSVLFNESKLLKLERDQKLTSRIEPIQKHCNRTEIKKGFA